MILTPHSEMCGGFLEEEGLKMINCFMCGKEISDISYYCYSCGSKIEIESKQDAENGTINCSSDEWVEYDRDYYGDVYFYNKASVQHTAKDIIQVMCKVVYSDEDRNKLIRELRKNGLPSKGYNKLSHRLHLEKIDYKGRKYQTLSLSEYDTDGRILFRGSSDKPGWEHIIPDSIMDTLQKKVCK